MTVHLTRSICAGF